MRFGIIILKNLTRRKMRSILTIIAIGVGIGALVSLVSMSQGVIAMWEEGAAKRRTDLVLLQSSRASSTIFSSIDHSLQSQLESIPGVKSVRAFLIDALTIDDRPFTSVVGVKLLEHAEDIPDDFHLIDGRVFHPGKNEIIMGKILAQNLDRKLGDEVDMEADIFTIVGIFESSTGFEMGGIIIDLDELQELMEREGKVSSFELQLEDRALIPTVKKTIETTIPSITAMERREWGERDFGLRLIRATAWGVSFIALIVGVIGTVNTMFMSVFERTREIGILRALGWRSSRVLKMVLGESICLSLLGGIFGCLFGVLIVNFLALFPQAQVYIYGKFSLKLFIQAITIALSLGVGGGLYPALRASRLSPLEAIRYE